MFLIESSSFESKTTTKPVQTDVSPVSRATSRGVKKTTYARTGCHQGYDENTERTAAATQQEDRDHNIASEGRIDDKV